MNERIENAVQFVKANPVKVAGITIGVVLTGLVVYKALQYGGEIPEELGAVADSVAAVAEVAEEAL